VIDELEEQSGGSRHLEPVVVVLPQLDEPAGAIDEAQ